MCYSFLVEIQKLLLRRIRTQWLLLPAEKTAPPSPCKRNGNAFAEAHLKVWKSKICQMDAWKQAEDRDCRFGAAEETSILLLSLSRWKRIADILTTVLRFRILSISQPSVLRQNLNTCCVERPEVLGPLAC